ncbi:MAG: asparagine synthase (glutamine-hydrolyzing) [Candidatus Omnitrophica bacterium]|nr:asparagine synthase (glutamine-hydrolyzing) [Candidatus Omnitrophota bacterium]
MCGIAGIFNRSGKPVSRNALQQMTEALAHRGPDGQGQHIDNNLGLGHRRLAVLDPTPNSHQPMQSPDSRYTLSYNGEIYNFRELRTELESLGYRFRSSGDTEVALYALMEWGIDALSRFNGMFALAFWDSRQRELLICRDRYGIKPLYYAFCGKTLLIGSEVQAILANPAFEMSPDMEGLLEYFTFQNFFTDRTLYKGVHLLPAGSYARLAENSQELSVHRYWDYRFVEPAQVRSEAEYSEELDRLFRQAVKRQLVSDVEVGAYLSGGMDSGSITAVAAKELPNIKTFTAGFDLHSASGLELGFDERDKAERMSYRFQTEHYEMILKAGDMERVLPKIMRHLGEPRVGQSYPNYCVAKLAARFVKVVLAGTGGDELFGGYPWRYYSAASSSNFEEFVDHYYLYWQRLIPNQVIKKVFSPVWPQVKGVWTRDIFRDVLKQHPNQLRSPEDYINQSFYLEAKTFLHALLNIEDKLSMAHGLETRVPFLDNDLVDFAIALPVRLKLGKLRDSFRIDENEPGPKSAKYYSRTHNGKLLLRRVMERHLPAEISQAPKQGFSGPDASWFRGESLEFVRRQLLTKNALIYDFMDRKAVHCLIREHLEEKVNRRLLIWSLLCVEEWCQQNLGPGSKRNSNENRSSQHIQTASV